MEQKAFWKPLLVMILALLLCAQGYFALQLYQLSKEQQQIKTDYSNVNNITFGLFSIEQWRKKVSDIIRHQVNTFEMTPEQKKQLRKEVEVIMVALIDKAEELINKKKKTVGGKIKKFAIKTFVNTDKIKEKVPGFAGNIVEKIDDRSTKRKMGKLAEDKFEDLEHTEFVDSAIKATMIATGKVYNKYHVKSTPELNKILLSRLSAIKKATYQYTFAMMGCIAAVLLIWWLLRLKTGLHATLFMMSLIFAFVMLGVGLTASMIEVDARIQTFDFMLLGKHIVFENQVLFFQSKSIMDVVTVLIQQPAIDSILVGALIFIFSVLFPVLKISATGVHLLAKKRIAENRVIRYFAFRSGKWSMADVIVIAILMVYIGLNGLLESQLKGMNIKTDILTVITTHNTALQPGYIIFICFVLYGLILSTILKYISPHEKH